MVSGKEPKEEILVQTFGQIFGKQERSSSNYLTKRGEGSFNSLIPLTEIWTLKLSALPELIKSLTTKVRQPT